MRARSSFLAFNSLFGKMKIGVYCVVLPLLASLVAACIPPPTVECSASGKGCTVFNNQGFWEDRSDCHAATSATPTTEEQLLAAVAHAVKNKQKINVVSDLAHSHPKLACVGEGGLIISTRHYDSIVRINSSADPPTITVESGALMRDVIDEAAKAGLALPTLTSWDGVSAAGCISTGAHGSGFLGKGSIIDEYVVGIRLVVPAPASQGYAKVIHLTQADPDLKAARLSLGTLGVISQVTFALEPMFKRSISITLEDDDGLENQLESFWRSHEFGKIYWYVAFGKALMERVDRVSVHAPGDGVNKASYQPTTVLRAEQSAATYERIAREGDVEELCNISATSMYSRVANGDGYLNDGVTFTGNPVVGFNHKMQSTGGCQVYGRKQENDSACLPDKIIGENKSICEWDRRVRGSLVYDMELRVPLAVAGAAMKDIKALRDLNPQAMCALNGILLRTLKKSESYLGPSDDLLTFEISYPRSRQAFTPTWNMDFYQEIEQMLVEKYGGSLHWGKSGGHLFEGLAAKTVDLKRFLMAKKRFDPQGVFSNDWIERVLGIGGKRVEMFKQRCAVEKLCKCREDSHCAPDEGYFCRPGRLWKNARVCRKLD